MPPSATAGVINRLSHAVDLIEKRIQQNRPWKVVKVRRGFREDGNVARARHFAAHPEDHGRRDLRVFSMMREGADESQNDAAASTVFLVDITEVFRVFG